MIAQRKDETGRIGEQYFTELKMKPCNYPSKKKQTSTSSAVEYRPRKMVGNSRSMKICEKSAKLVPVSSLKRLRSVSMSVTSAEIMSCSPCRALEIFLRKELDVFDGRGTLLVVGSESSSMSIFRTKLQGEKFQKNCAKTFLRSNVMKIDKVTPYTRKNLQPFFVESETWVCCKMDTLCARARY